MNDLNFALDRAVTTEIDRSSALLPAYQECLDAFQRRCHEQYLAWHETRRAGRRRSRMARRVRATAAWLTHLRCMVPGRD